MTTRRRSVSEAVAAKLASGPRPERSYGWMSRMRSLVPASSAPSSRVALDRTPGRDAVCRPDARHRSHRHDRLLPAGRRTRRPDLHRTRGLPLQRRRRLRRGVGVALDAAVHRSAAARVDAHRPRRVELGAELRAVPDLPGARRRPDPPGRLHAGGLPPRLPLLVLRPLDAAPARPGREPPRPRAGDRGRARGTGPRGRRGRRPALVPVPGLGSERGAPRACGARPPTGGRDLQRGAPHPAAPAGRSGVARPRVHHAPGGGRDGATTSRPAATIEYLGIAIAAYAVAMSLLAYAATRPIRPIEMRAALGRSRATIAVLAWASSPSALLVLPDRLAAGAAGARACFSCSAAGR